MTIPAIVEQRTVDLDIVGMTCASCANRIERKLNKVEDVTASVNYATEKAKVTYPASLDPQVLLDTVASAGYEANLPASDGTGAAKQSKREDLFDLGERLVLSGLLTVPVVLLAMVPAWQVLDWQWLSLILTLPVVTWGALPFHQAAWTNLRHKSLTMDTLVSLGVTAAFGWSLNALIFGTAGTPGMKHTFAFLTSPSDGASSLYLEVAAAVTTLVLAGRFVEARSKRRSGQALKALMEAGAKSVTILRTTLEGKVLEEEVPLSALRVGDLFVVRPGEKVATDGHVQDGTSTLDASLLTGESLPVEAGPGAQVVGATTNLTGRLIVKASQVGASTQLAQMARLVEEAQSGKAHAQRLADRVSGVFVPVVVSFSVLTFVAWLLLDGSVTMAFSAAVAVLVVACPCALGLATPTALMVGTGRAAQLGILIRGPEVLESTRKVDTVVLDKTGTLTTGKMTLKAVLPAAGEDPDLILKVAGGLEDASEHPIAKAIVLAARERHGDLPRVEGFHNEEGLGVTGIVNLGEGPAQVVIGRRGLIEKAAGIDPELASAVEDAQGRGETVSLVAWSGKVRGALTVSDTVKESSTEAVAELKMLGLTPYLLTGDNILAARSVAAQVGIEAGRVIAEVLPVEKAQVIKNLQAEGRAVVMVGDGINDAAALAQADLGLAMGSGTDVAIAASDLTLVNADPKGIATAVHLSRRTLGVIKGNLFWAFAYNVAAIPLAALGILNPMLAGAAMAFSSVFVVTNSLRLRKFNPHTFVMTETKNCTDRASLRDSQLL